jgi:hypothetical protein
MPRRVRDDETTPRALRVRAHGYRELATMMDNPVTRANLLRSAELLEERARQEEQRPPEVAK